MCRLLESIHLLDGVFRNLEYHERRMKVSATAVGFRKTTFNLTDILASQPIPQQGLYKTRIEYDEIVQKIEFVPYSIRPVQSLKLINSDEISYHHKFLDRSSLDKLFSQRGPADDILIVKDSKITDSYYANIIFRSGTRWFTPRSCLLNGTMREYLLDRKQIEEADITIDNYHQFEAFKLINAMLGMDSPEVSTQSIS